MADRNIEIDALDRRAVEKQAVEIVERKGTGHPDSICDGVAEHVSRALAQAYLDRVGTVLHFNTDETQLVAGRAEPAFGGGEVIEPIYLLIVGRATKEYEGTHVPTDTIALEAAREYLASTVPRLDFGTDVVVDVDLNEGSGDLKQVFGEDGIGVPEANDTSFGVGYAPLSETERIVLEAEREVNRSLAEDTPAVGPDVKVMGKRQADRIDVTVAAAMVDAHVPDMATYRDRVAEVESFVEEVAARHTDLPVSVHVNTADDYDAGAVYLTTTGTSAEQGDDGSVGRGNRVNGLITPNRPMSLEASSGKNPVNHIGKIYNILATEIAEDVADGVEGVEAVQLMLLSQIGQPIDRPQVADVGIRTAEGRSVGDVAADVEAVVDDRLENVTDLTRRVIDGEVTTF